MGVGLWFIETGDEAEQARGFADTFVESGDWDFQSFGGGVDVAVFQEECSCGLFDVEGHVFGARIPRKPRQWLVASWIKFEPTLGVAHSGKRLILLVTPMILVYTLGCVKFPSNTSEKP